MRIYVCYAQFHREFRRSRKTLGRQYEGVHRLPLGYESLPVFRLVSLERATRRGCVWAGSTLGTLNLRFDKCGVVNG